MFTSKFDSVQYWPDFYASYRVIFFFLLTTLNNFVCVCVCVCVLLVDVFTNPGALTHPRAVCLRPRACLAGTGGLAFNTCTPASPHRCSLPPQDATFFNRLKMELAPAESPRESTHRGSAGSTFQHSTWIIAALYIEGNVFFFLPLAALSLAPPRLSGDLGRSPRGECFFKVKTLTLPNRGGPRPRLLLAICVSPYGSDAFMPQIARVGGLNGFVRFLFFFYHPLFFFPAVLLERKL